MKRRFIFVDYNDGYFHGELCWRGGPVGHSKFSTVKVLDLQDLTIQKVRLEDILSIDRNYFFIPPEEQGNGRYDLSFRALNWYVGFDDRLYRRCSPVSNLKLYGNTVSINGVECGLEGKDWETFHAIRGNERYAVCKDKSRYEDFNLVFFYKRGRDLVLCYQIERDVFWDEEVYSLSLAFDLESAEFKGYFIYGEVPKIEKIMDFYMPSLSKEILRV